MARKQTHFHYLGRHEIQRFSRREFGSVATAAVIAARGSGSEEGSDYELYDYHFEASIDGFSDRLRKAREAKGLTIEQCAHAFEPGCQNYWYGEWHGWENRIDVPSYYYWPTIEALLGASAVSLLFGGSEVATARSWVQERLADYEPAGGISRDIECCPVSDRIRMLREKSGKSAADCAKAVEVDEKTWQHIECGMQITTKHGFKICQLFKVSTHYLIFGEDKAEA